MPSTLNCQSLAPFYVANSAHNLCLFFIAIARTAKNHFYFLPSSLLPSLFLCTAYFSSLFTFHCFLRFPYLSLSYRFPKKFSSLISLVFPLYSHLLGCDVTTGSFSVIKDNNRQFSAFAVYCSFYCCSVWSPVFLPRPNSQSFSQLRLIPYIDVSR